jgi:hypothetical protein
MVEGCARALTIILQIPGKKIKISTDVKPDQ